MADATTGKGISIPVTLDTKGVDKGMSNLEKRLDQLDHFIKMASSDLEGMKDELKQATAAGDTKSINELKVAIQSAEKDLAGYVNEQKNLQGTLERSNAEQTKQATETKKTATEHRSLKGELREVTQQLAVLSAEGKKGSAEYTQLAQRAGVLKDAMMDANTAVTNLASDTANMDAVLSAASLGTGGFTAITGAMDLMGMSSEDVAEAQRKLQGAIAITTGVQSIQMALQKESALMLKVHNVQTTYAAAKEEILAAAQAKGVAVTKAHVVAQAALNTVMKANPIVLLIAALAGLAVAVGKVITKTNEQKKAQEEANQAYADSMSEAQSEITTMNAYLGIAKDVTKSLNQRKKAISELNSKYPQLKASLNSENGQLIINTQAYNEYAQSIINAAKAKAYEDKVSEWTNKQLKYESDATSKKQAWENAEATYKRQYEYMYGKDDRGGMVSMEGMDQAQVTLGQLDNKRKQAEAAYRLALKNAGTSEYNAQVYANRAAGLHTSGTIVTSSSPTTASVERPEIGSDEWLFGTDKNGNRWATDEQYAQYWQMIYNGIEEAAKNNPIKVPIEIDEEELQRDEATISTEWKTGEQAVNAFHTDNKISSAQKLASVTQRISNSMSEIAQSINDADLNQLADVLGTISENLMTAVSGLEKDKNGNLSISASSVLDIWFSVLNKIVSIYTSDKAYWDKMNLASQKAADNMILAANEIKDIYDNAFGTDAASKFADTINAYRNLSSSYTTALNKLNKEYTRRYKTDYIGLTGDTQTHSYLYGYEVGSGSNKDLLGHIAPWLFNSDQTINTDMLDQFIDSDYFDMLGDEVKQQLKNLQELNDKMKEYADSMRDYISDTFGEMGDAAMNSIVNAIETGADSWEDFKKAGADAIEELGEQMIYKLFLSDQFSKFQEKIGQYVDGQGNIDWEGIMSATSDFMSEMENTWLPAATEFGNKFKEAAASNGFSIFGNDAQSTAQGAISSVTEQTASLIEGQMNAIRMQQIDANAIMRDQLMLLSGIKDDTSYIRSIDSRLARMEGNYSSRILNA